MIRFLKIATFTLHILEANDNFGIYTKMQFPSLMCLSIDKNMVVGQYVERYILLRTVPLYGLFDMTIYAPNKDYATISFFTV